MTLLCSTCNNEKKTLIQFQSELSLRHALLPHESRTKDSHYVQCVRSSILNMAHVISFSTVADADGIKVKTVLRSGLIKITSCNQNTTRLFCHVVVDDLFEFASGG